MAFPTKAERQKCWDSRDRYWECLEANNVGLEDPDPFVCQQVRKMYESLCPSQWVKHFDRKRSYNAFKKKIETEGYEPLRQTSLDTQNNMDAPRKQRPFKRLVPDTKSVQ